MMYFSSNKEIVTIGALDFVIYKSAREIQNTIHKLAKRIEKDYTGKKPVFLVVLNGAFMFAADLVRYMDISCEVSFVKISSYKGLASTGQLKIQMVNEKDLANRHVVIIEDIIDSGFTMKNYLPKVYEQNPKSIKICALLEKPDATKHDISIDYLGFSIPEKFVVGYGLDFDGVGRNLPHLYQLIDEAP